jgi:hypothetical protein
MTRILLIVLVVAGAASFSVPAAHADPPGPPTPPGCHPCGGPPVPPTPVSTLSPGTVPLAHTVSVELAPLHVKRGETAKASVTASATAHVSLVVHYHRGKPVTYRATIGTSGKLVKEWRVPKKAPLGKATVKVTVDGTGDPYVTTIPLVIIR